MPQYVLEDAAARGAPCSIVCTQPRRISAVGVAERVAAERGEAVGGAEANPNPNPNPIAIRELATLTLSQSYWQPW